MSLPAITEAIIRQHSSPQSFERGHEYYQEGAVISLVQRGATLDAEVAGSEPEPYRVRVIFAGVSIREATCTCPYEYGGWCKHIVAALLAAARKPEQVEQRPPLADVLAKLNRDQLQALVLKLVEHEPDLADTVELQAGLVTPAAPPAASSGAAGVPAALPPVDVALVRRRMRAVMRSAGDWDYGAMSGVVSEVSQLLEQAWERIRAGDGRNALAVLDAITPEYVESWYEFDDSDGEGGDFFREIGAAWAEALLTAGLPKQERTAWAGKLTTWAGEVADYGIDDAFDPAIAAAEQGWDDPHLQRILQGESTPSDRAVPQRVPDQVWDEEEDWAARTLTVARLNVLERQGRYEELLRLADAEGQPLRAALTLVQLGRNHDAIASGLERLVSAGDAFELAQALHQRGETVGAIQVAGRGLDLAGPRAELANWLRDLALEQGDPALALQAAQAAFAEQLDLPSFLKVQELAGDQWSDLRLALLERLRGVKSYVPAGPVEVFLHEGLLDDAIAAVEKGAGHELVERVVDAALTARPNWAIAACRQQADWIMDGGKSEYYDAAARWLAKARTAYQAAGRGEEWRTYLGDLLTTHQRKYKLRPLLETLR